MEICMNATMLEVAMSLCAVVAVTGMVVAGDAVSIADFGGKADDGSDTTPAVQKALRHCREHGIKRLVFPKGRYDFWGDLAEEKFFHVSNNDDGLKRISFPVFGFRGLEIDGQGSRFVFHGFVNPFIIEGATALRIRNLAIDFERTFHSEGKIIETTEEGLVVEFSDAYPFEIRCGVLAFTDGKRGEKRIAAGRVRPLDYPWGNLLEFDPVKRETAYMARDYWAGNGLPARRAGKNRVLLLDRRLKATPGNVMVFGPSHRHVPAFVITDSADIRLEDVTIHHCGGMGVIAQMSRDISLERVAVTPAPGRILSATADATHFVNCEGSITMAHCVFENQKDDPTNIHGLYARVVERTGPAELLVQLVHHQQRGLELVKPGGRVELVQGGSLVTYGEAVVREVHRLNDEFTRLVFAETLPDRVKQNDAVGSLRDFPTVHIHHCRMHGNRARGFLVNSRGRTVIEENHFHVPGSAILFEGDAHFWYEQAGVRDCVIRNNVFDNCNYGVWGQATIEVKAGIDEEHRPTSRYNRNVVIEGNTFRVYDMGPIVSAYCIDGLRIRNNRIEKTNAYPPRELESAPFVIRHCDRVVLEKNSGVERTGPRADVSAEALAEEESPKQVSPGR
jgi:hypothetical protein